MRKVIFSFLIVVSLKIYAQNADLESLFLNPPTTAKPYVWWHWMGSNFSKEGITRDLEAMKAMGIGGATIFNLTSAVQESHAPTQNNPWPEQTYRSPAYWDAMKHAASEAQRLGLELGLHNTVGYSTTGGPWIDEPRSMQQLVWSDTIVTGTDKAMLISLPAPILKADEGWGATGRKISYYKDVMVLAIPADKKNLSVSDVVNLTLRFDTIKGLLWQIPKGENWKIYRIGHSSTGRAPHPIPEELLGKTLEADKMSNEQSVFHWTEVLAPLKKVLGEYIGKSFRHILIDSYEAGNQTWTPDFVNQFKKLKGYDPTPWLLTFVKPITNYSKTILPRIIESEEQSNRFEWDYRDVVNTLFMINGFDVAKKMLKNSQLEFQWEPYGGPFNTQQGVALSDLPMGEFWTTSNGSIGAEIPAVARATGKKIVGAEAFTGRPEVSKFTEDPAMLKLSADGAFASGVNRLILHHWVHQPFDDKYQPGMDMGWWGTHFGRHQTWAQSGKAFFDYLARCQVLLQTGQGVGDYLCVGKLVGNADLISINDFLSLDIKVKDGKVILPSGRSYPFLYFDNTVMLPQTLRKIKTLIQEGATVAGPKPTKSPSLQNYPACDAEIAKLANELWSSEASNKSGKGLIFTKLDDAIKYAGITPAYIIERATDASAIKVAYRLDEKSSFLDKIIKSANSETHIFYMANMAQKEQQLSVSYRVSGLQPELWQAETGTVVPAAVWHEKDGRTTVNFKLGSEQTVFVVFRNKLQHASVVADVLIPDSVAYNILLNNKQKPVIVTENAINATVKYNTGKEKNITTKAASVINFGGDWQVSFVPKLDKPYTCNFTQLIDFSKHSEKDINYFSGIVTYSKSISIDSWQLGKSKHLELDLGELNDLAQVKINGREVATLWYPPYKVDVTAYLKKGENLLEIAITVNWANRLIGDEKHPADFEWGRDRGEKMGRAMKAYPDWFLKNEARPSQGRKTFNIWYYYRDNSELQPAGLVGPVVLKVMHEVKL